MVNFSGVLRDLRPLPRHFIDKRPVERPNRPPLVWQRARSDSGKGSLGQNHRKILIQIVMKNFRQMMSKMFHYEKMHRIWRGNQSKFALFEGQIWCWNTNQFLVLWYRNNNPSILETSRYKFWGLAKILIDKVDGKTLACQKFTDIIDVHPRCNDLTPGHHLIRNSSLLANHLHNPLTLHSTWRVLRKIAGLRHLSSLALCLTTVASRSTSAIFMSFSKGSIPNGTKNFRKESRVELNPMGKCTKVSDLSSLVPNWIRGLLVSQDWPGL